MPTDRIVAPYGTWPSPLSAEELAAGAVRLGEPRSDGDMRLWLEARPTEGGRQVLIRRHADGRLEELTPAGGNTRSRVHEYGGTPFAARDGVVVAAEWADQRWYRLDTGTPEPITPEPEEPAALRYADAEITHDGWLVCVREQHTSDGQVHNEIVAAPLEGGEPHVLVGGPRNGSGVSGRDFVAAPRVSPDGRELAWLAWDHPDMPWDAAELWCARVDVGSGRLSHAIRLSIDGEAAFQPLWTPDGHLYAAVDRTGWWELARRTGDHLRVLTELEVELGQPLWTVGSRSLALLPDGRIAAAAVDRAKARVIAIDPASGHAETLAEEWTLVRSLQPTAQGELLFQAASPAVSSAIVVLDPADGRQQVLRESPAPVEHEAIPIPEAIDVPTPDGVTTHAFLYRPASATHRGPEDEQPPLLVITHGGPTGNTVPILSREILFWTTRGFAVADVNYRGSTGYGRAYRDALHGNWGVHDVTDVRAVARWLGEHGEVDPQRMAIRGGSAGGFTTLAALTRPDNPFAAGCDYFGVADLKALADHTHKFESRYLDRLVGPLPAAHETYRDRSPLTHVDRLSCPILVLQGLEDVIVPPAQSEAIVEAARRRGIPHAYLAFEGEQHGFRKAENIVAWLESELAFYGEVFGFKPADEGARIQLVTG